MIIDVWWKLKTFLIKKRKKIPSSLCKYTTARNHRSLQMIDDFSLSRFSITLKTFFIFSYRKQRISRKAISNNRKLRHSAQFHFSLIKLLIRCSRAVEKLSFVYVKWQMWRNNLKCFKCTHICSVVITILMRKKSPKRPDMIGSIKRDQGMESWLCGEGGCLRLWES